ncbi:hypothetical protein ASF40_04575 [Microbacterium sp. Leaf288]|nr:hypothetical protein ASF40_04575 [Microbacterium sp. Leaf288]
MSNQETHVDVSLRDEASDSPATDVDLAEGQVRTKPVATAEPEDCGPLNRCENYVVAGPPDVTLADLASFRPAQPTLGGEPAGFGVVGMPTNLLASASEQRIPGTVLGWDVTVRFVPVAYVFDNGDGTTTRASTGGASWTALGQGQFTPTATSHAYRARGTYPVSVTVEYEASVDFGSGTWRTVPGVVRAEATGYGVRVVEVRTALVDRTCVEDPTGPGC